MVVMIVELLINQKLYFYEIYEVVKNLLFC